MSTREPARRPWWWVALSCAVGMLLLTGSAYSAARTVHARTSHAAPSPLSSSLPPTPNASEQPQGPQSPSPSSSSQPQAASAPTPEEEITRQAPDLNKGVWVKGPNLPSARQNAAAVVLANRIYVIGGFGPHDRQMDTTLVWEPEVVPGSPRGEAEHAGARIGVWTYAARIPEPVDNAGAAAVGSYIYVAGGRIENVVTNKFWRYDAADDTWTELPSMPIPRFGPAMQAIGDRLYVLGGAISHGQDYESMMVFDIPSQRWTVYENAIAYERVAPASAIIDNKIALVGGRTSDEFNVPFCDLFDPENDSWTTCNAMHQPRSDFGLSSVNGRLVAVGGDDLRFYQATQTMEISEPAGRGWLSGPWMPSPRHGMAQVTLGNVVWVIGGSSSTGTAPTNTVLRFISPLITIKFKKGHS